MIYKSYEDLSGTIRRNLWKIPDDIDLIVGVPRSGMIAALMVAEILNRRCADLDAFAEGRVMSCGDRMEGAEGQEIRKVLVIDDTVNTGRSIKRARKSLAHLQERFTIIYGCVYARGKDAKNMVDLFLEDIFVGKERWYLYEWNILHHNENKTSRMMWDIDGLMCLEPPSEKNTESYEAYIREAVPMVLPTATVGAIVTYRLEKYRPQTEEWLARSGVRFKRLRMFDAPDRETRRYLSSPGKYKAAVYNAAHWAMLFVESDPHQAEMIHSITRKPVYCYENGKMYY